MDIKALTERAAGRPISSELIWEALGKPDLRTPLADAAREQGVELEPHTRLKNGAVTVWTLKLPAPSGKAPLYVLIAEAVYDHGVIGIYTTPEAARDAAMDLYLVSDGHHGFRIEELEVDVTYEPQFDLKTWEPTTLPSLKVEVDKRVPRVVREAPEGSQRSE